MCTIKNINVSEKLPKYLEIDNCFITHEFDNKLSAVNLKTKEVVSQEAIRKDFKAV